MTMKIMQEAAKKSAKRIKRNLVNLKRAAKEAGMEKAYGVNGPLGQLAIDAVFPGEESHLFERLLSKDKRAIKIREAYKYTLGKQLDPYALISDKMDRLNTYLGASDSEDTFSRLAHAVKKDKKGKLSMDKLIDRAQNTDLLKAKVSRYKKEDKAKVIPKDMARANKASPLSDSTKGMVNTVINAGAAGMEEVAKFKKAGLLKEQNQQELV